MTVNCQSCNAEYKLDATKVPATGGFFKCKACGGKVQIPAQDAAAPVAPPAIPLAASAPTPTAIPLADSATPKPTAIPLAASAPPPPPPTAPTPLPWDTAKPATPAPIALAGSATPTPGAAPLQPPAAPKLSLDDLPQAVDDDLIEDMEPLDDDFTDDDPSDITSPGFAAPQAPVAAQPSAIALAASPTTTSIALGGSTPDFEATQPSAAAFDTGALDLSSDDLPAPADAVADLDDLPAPSPAALGLGLDLDDLPIGAPISHLDADDLPQPANHEFSDGDPNGSIEFGDLPTPSQLQTDNPFGDMPPPPLDMDLPTPIRPSAPPPQIGLDADFMSDAGVPDDLPRVPDADEAPRFMDDLPAQVPSADAISASPFASVPTAPAAFDSHDSHASNDAPPAATKSKRPMVLGLVALGIAASVAVVMYGLPLLGIDLLNPNATTAVATRNAQKRAAALNNKPPDKTADAVPAQEAPKEVVVLSADNIDTLAYADLRAAAQKHATSAGKANDPEHQGLLFWAWYRMARLGDAEAQRELANVPKAPQAQTDRLAAASLGAMALSGKVLPAQKFAEKLSKTRFKKSTALLLVQAQAMQKPAELAKAEKLYAEVLTLLPAHKDAALGKAQLAAKQGDVLGLVKVAQDFNDPAVSLWVANDLIASERYASADTLTATWTIKDLPKLPANQQESFLRLMVRRKLRGGDVAAASDAAYERVKLAPDNAAASIELARLTQLSAKAQVQPLLEAARSQVKDPKAQAMLVLEQVRLALSSNEVAKAEAVIKAADGLAKGGTAPYLKLAQGYLLEREGKAKEARAAYTQAAAGKLALPDAQLALMALTPTKPGPAMLKLTQLTKKDDLPAANYQLARLMATTGNVAGAAALLDKVLWADPTVEDPRALFALWVDWTFRSGQKERALALAESFLAAEPKDDAPLDLLIGLATKGEDPTRALPWYRQKAALHPKEAVHQLALAQALSSAGKGEEAEQVLVELLKRDPDAKNAEFLLQLGRAWHSRDVVKARGLINEALIKEASARGNVVLGDLEAKEGRTDEAALAYKKALTLDATLLHARFQLAKLYMQKEALDHAATELRQILAQNPKDARAAEMLGDILLDQDQAKNAAKSYQDALAIVGEDAAILLKLARLQLESLSVIPAAIKTLRRAIVANENAAEAHYMLGLALKDTGKSVEAKRALEAYVRLAPEGEFAKDAARFIVDLGKN